MQVHVCLLEGWVEMINDKIKNISRCACMLVYMKGISGELSAFLNKSCQDTLSGAHGM